MGNEFGDVQKVIEKYTKGGKDGNNLVSDIGDFINQIYNYLDSLTLLEESAFLHLIIFMILLLTVFNILGIFFGNEIIKYFDLENKYPKLYTFFKVRAMFQRYYLMWNIFVLFVVCIVGICINLLVFY